jgi:hypothetical protein
MSHDFPALDGRPVMQRHADQCMTEGHAVWTTGGADTGVCPRCGEVTESESVALAKADRLADRRIATAYRTGWKHSANPDRADLETEEDRYARNHSAAQQDAWSAGWIDYASDYAYGTALTELTR